MVFHQSDSIWFKLAGPYLPIVTNICTMYYNLLKSFKPLVSYVSGRKNISYIVYTVELPRAITPSLRKQYPSNLQVYKFKQYPTIVSSFIEILITIGKLWLRTDKHRFTYSIQYVINKVRNSSTPFAIYLKLAGPHFLIALII